jgi:hypothetical protein
MLTVKEFLWCVFIVSLKRLYLIFAFLWACVHLSLSTHTGIYKFHPSIQWRCNPNRALASSIFCLHNVLSLAASFRLRQLKILAASCCTTSSHFFLGQLGNSTYYSRLVIFRHCRDQGGSRLSGCTKSWCNTVCKLHFNNNTV